MMCLLNCVCAYCRITCSSSLFGVTPPRQLIVIKSGVEDGHPFVPAGHAGPKQAGQKRPAEDESLGDLRS